MYMQVKASWLSVQSYCDQQLYLKVCRVPATDRPESTDRGQKLADMVEQAQAKYQPFTVREIDICGGRVYGRPKLLEYHLNHIAITDTGTRPRTGEPYPGDRRQVLAYCMAFADQFPDNHLPIIAKLRDPQGAEFWTHEFTDADRADLNNAIDRVLGIINGIREPFPTTKPYKCQTCPYRKDCDVSPLYRR
jgi:CRISPR/Cas system-associated exonuclease Cas4 (RecB family)